MAKTLKYLRLLHMFNMANWIGTGKVIAGMEFAKKHISVIFKQEPVNYSPSESFVLQDPHYDSLHISPSAEAFHQRRNIIFQVYGLQLLLNQ